MRFVSLSQVSLADMAEYGLYPAGQVRKDGRVWVAMPAEVSDDKLLNILTKLGITPTWREDAGHLFLECSADEERLETPKLEVQVCSWLGATSAKFRSTLLATIERMLLPALRKPINLWVPHNTVRDPIYGPEFNIFVWASPTPRDEGWRSSERLFGRPHMTIRNENQFGKWAEGVPILSSEGYEVGAVDGNNLFLYHDLVHTGSNDELLIWQDLLHEVVKVLATTDETFDRDRARTLYGQLCSRRISQQMRENETKRSVLREEADTFSKKHAAALRQLDQVDKEAGLLATAAASSQEKFEKEFDSLLQVPKIRAVSFRGKTLVISTDIITAINPATGKTHEIGKFKFIIDTELSTVRLMNQTRLVHGYRERMQAPHVFPDGRPCLGNLEVTIPSLVAAYEFSALAQILIAYIESVNLEDGAGRYIQRWPEVLKDGTLRVPDNGAREVRILSIEEMREQTKKALAALDEEKRAKQAAEDAKKAEREAQAAREAAACATAAQEAAAEASRAATEAPAGTAGEAGQAFGVETDINRWMRG